MKKYNFENSSSLSQLLDGFVNSTIGDFIGSDFINSHPRANVLENNSDYIIQLAAPGLIKSDFKITMEGDQLKVSGEDRLNEHSKELKFTRREFNYGKFNRSFNLPESIDRKNVKASYKEGILSITLPKLETKVSDERDIEIK